MEHEVESDDERIPPPLSLLSSPPIVGPGSAPVTRVPSRSPVDHGARTPPPGRTVGFRVYERRAGNGIKDFDKSERKSGEFVQNFRISRREEGWGGDGWGIELSWDLCAHVDAHSNTSGQDREDEREEKKSEQKEEIFRSGHFLPSFN
eukprot:1392693-Amorphochlora_amoeboformis.AAC.1